MACSAQTRLALMPVAASRPLDPKASSTWLAGSATQHAALRAAGLTMEDDDTACQRPCAKAHTSASAVLSLAVPPAMTKAPLSRHAAAAALLPGGRGEELVS